MADGHCFISYSTVDALDFARKLANKLKGDNIAVWFDKDDLKPSMDWDIQIDHALKTCRMVLFVMTADSTHEKSVCRQEWSRALSFKKPIVPLWVQNDIEVPFRLQDRQRIDFRKSFDAGLANLRDYLAWLESPEGILQAYKDRLLDAERDLQRARVEDKPRIQLDIEELTKQIQAQEKVVANPEAAQKRTQINIEAGLERERQTEKPISAKGTTRFINPPPELAPNYFQDRTVETRQVFNFLKNDAQRLMTIIGRGGVGKTAMVCRLLRGIETGELPDGLATLKTDGIIYLSENGSHRVNFANLFYDLAKLLPVESLQELDAIYKNPQASTESKMRALLEKFSNSELVVLLLDNFEPLIDTETFAIRDAELNEALRAFLNGTHTAVNILITTRAAPRALNLIQPGRQRVLTIDEGLESPYAENILREMDSDGRIRLKFAPAELLSRARERTRGYPRALEALFAILASDRYTSLEELLAMPTPENVVEALVGEAFNRLDVNAQKVMQALAVYNRPVTSAAVDYLLAPHLPATDSAPILQRLANMHFARKESGRYYLHPVDREFAFGLISEGKKKEERSDSDELRFTQYELLERAADYFAQARKPRAEWKKLDDLAAQLAEFDLRCAAGDYDTVANMLYEIDDLMQQWGHYRLTIQLNEWILDKLKDKFSVMSSLNELGWAYLTVGEIRKAIDFYQQGLDAAREEPKNRRSEGVFLGSLGNTYVMLGNAPKAIEYYEQALVIAHELGDRKGEGSRLGNLGSTYISLGNLHKAIEFLEQALSIARELGDRDGEVNRLSNLGNQYAVLGDAHKAIKFHEQALTIAREIGKRSDECSILHNYGDVLIDLGDFQNAIEKFYFSLLIADEINKLQTQIVARAGLAQAYLFQTDLVNARANIEAALQYNVPRNNHSVTSLYGIIILRQGEQGNVSEARHAFTRAIAQADELLVQTPEYYSALDTKGLALCGLAICRSRLRSPGRGQRDPGDREELSRSKRDLQDAIETFRTARKIAPHAGIVKRALRLFDELVKCDEEGILKDVRNAVEGKA